MRFILFLTMITIAFSACKQEKTLETPDGHKYIHHIKTGNPMPQPGDYVYFHAQIRDGEKVIRSSRDEGAAPYMQIPTEEMPGREVSPVESVLKLMGQGDSVTLLIELDSIQKQTMQVQSDIMYYDVVMVRLQPKAEREKELQAVRAVESEVAVKVAVTREDYQAGKLNSQIQTTASGLKYIVQEEGKGDKPQTGAGVQVHYYGVLASDGKMFDNSFSRGEPITFPLGLGQVIPGWDEGLALLKEGSKATFFIPANLAYGAQGSPPAIPGNAELIFYIELVDVQNNQ